MIALFKSIYNLKGDRHSSMIGGSVDLSTTLSLHTWVNVSLLKSAISVIVIDACENWDELSSFKIAGLSSFAGLAILDVALKKKTWN